MKRSFYGIPGRLRRLIRRCSAMQITAMVFAAMILAGGVLLSLPVSAKSAQPTPFLTALFTATSCTCVTGLSLVDTFSHWSVFGQCVMLVLIQVGGLGFMTIVTVFYAVWKRKIGLKERLVMAQSLGVEDLHEIVPMVRKVLTRTLLVEGIGALLLSIRFAMEMPLGKALWWGVFHGISAFCNAGFDIMGAVDAGGSLMAYSTDIVVNLVIVALIFVSGLGFFVWDDLLRHRKFRRCSVYTRLVLVLSTALTLGGAALFAALEWNNPQTIGQMNAAQKCLASLFQSMTTRTAGFYTIPQGAMTDASKVLTDVLMFIGGSSGSTAGGVKTVTMGVVVLSAWATARGQSRVTVFRRTIAPQQTGDAVCVVTMAMVLVLGSAMILSVANGLPFMDCMYEAISALATVGLTTGITTLLGPGSQVILIILMFFGRVGIMTISLGFLLSDRTQERYEFAQTRVLIG